ATSAAASVGVRAITAEYSGYTTCPASTSHFVGQTLHQASTTTSLTSSLNPLTSGRLVAFTSVVTAISPGAGTPTGNVSFRDGSTVLGTSPLVNGTATFSSTTLSVATHQIAAVYGGDGNFMQSTSTVLTQTVNQAAPTGTPSQKFVTQVFRDLLGRDPDPGGLTHFTMLLDMN